MTVCDFSNFIFISAGDNDERRKTRRQKQNIKHGNLTLLNYRDFSSLLSKQARFTHSALRASGLAMLPVCCGLVLFWHVYLQQLKLGRMCEKSTVPSIM